MGTTRTSSEFRASPEFIRGRSSEQRVAQLLQRLGWFVIPSYDYAGADGNKAPKLQGRWDAYVIPDLDVSKLGRRRWVEVKTKAHADLTRITQRFEHGIPLRHFESYQRVQVLTGCKVYLFICEDDTGKILAKSIDELDAHKRVYRGGGMSYGGMVFFPRDCFDVFFKGSP